MTLNELFAGLGLKTILIVIAAFCIFFGIIFSFYYFNKSQETSAIKMENTQYYDNTTGSVVLANNTASLSGLDSCDIFVSGPSKKIKYLDSVGCDSLSATEISKQDLLDLFNGQKGTYTIIINSQQKSTGRFLQFSIA
jgi:hypothetical protein